MFNSSIVAAEIAVNQAASPSLLSPAVMVIELARKFAALERERIHASIGNVSSALPLSCSHRKEEFQFPREREKEKLLLTETVVLLSLVCTTKTRMAVVLCRPMNFLWS